MSNNKLRFVENNLGKLDKIGEFVDSAIITISEDTLLATVSFKIDCGRHLTHAFRMVTLSDQLQGGLDTVLCSDKDTFRAQYGAETAVGRSLLRDKEPNVVVPLDSVKDIEDGKALVFQSLLELAIMRTDRINDVVKEYNNDTESINKAIEAVEESTAEQLGEILH